MVGISEIDKYAIQAYMAVHGDTPNYGDISKIDWSSVPDFDFLTYSFPCTDISNTQQYKMAGNSIVVDVLYHIFRKMFVDTKDENKQLSLF